MDRPLSAGSLFSGLGGIDLAFERVGFQIAWQVENDPAANRVLARHWPRVPRYGDIRDVDPAELAPVDVVVFGSPCTDLSMAGKRAGLKGEHSGLFYEAIRIIQGIRPSVALWENVPGAFSSNAGRDFGAVLAAFRDSGVRELAWRVLDAQYFGVAQRRRRIFLVADFRAERACEILFEPQSLSGDPPSRQAAGQVAPSLLASGAGTDRPAGIGSELDFLIPEVSHTLLAKGNDSHDASMETYVLHDVRGTRDQHGIGITRDGPMYTLDTVSQHAVAYKERGDPTGIDSESSNPTRDRISHWRETSNSFYAVLANGPTAQESVIYKPMGRTNTISTTHVPMVVDPANMPIYHVRRLLPVECERLMGLPDGWTEWDAEGRALSDSARYRMIGNSVVVPVLTWIAERMRDAMGDPAEVHASEIREGNGQR